MTRRLLVDSDALLKLAQYGLLDTLVTMFGVDIGNIQVLATAKYSLLPAKNRLLRCKDEDDANRLEEFLTRLTPLSSADLDTNLLDILSAIPSIDAGEALLLAAGARDNGALVITGDKRALAALCADPSVAQVKEALAGRVVTLEVIFWQLVNQDFNHTQSRVRSKPDVDKAISNAFGVSAPATIDSVREALASYINHLQGVTGGLLLITPG